MSILVLSTFIVNYRCKWTCLHSFLGKMFSLKIICPAFTTNEERVDTTVIILWTRGSTSMFVASIWASAIILEYYTFLVLISHFRWISGAKTLWCTRTYSEISNQYSIAGIKPQTESTTTSHCSVWTYLPLHCWWMYHTVSNNCKYYTTDFDGT